MTSEVLHYREQCARLKTNLDQTTAALDTARTNYLNLEWQSDDTITRLQDETNDRERKKSVEVAMVNCRTNYLIIRGHRCTATYTRSEV